MLSSSNWQPSASIDTLRLRAQMLANIRDFFNQRDYLEVETPVMAQYGITDAYLSNIKAYFRHRPYCLQTSPEYHMKRLLAAGSGPIFQLARVFRDDELGRWHNPEFTLLEWYQLNIDHHLLMCEMDILLQTILACPPMQKKTYQHVFQEICSLDPFSASIDAFKSCLQQYNLADVLRPNESDRDQYLFLLMSHVIEPALANYPAPVAVYDFPPSQAALAKISHGVAERFEVYYLGVELANGFHELTEHDLQKDRFEQDRALRQKMGFDDCEPDIWLLQALEHGLPPCSGVALGIDRLFALSQKHDSLSQGMAFDFSRA